MANFTTHIAIGTVVSGALATLTLAADVVAPGKSRGGNIGGCSWFRAARHRPQGLRDQAARCLPGLPSSFHLRCCSTRRRSSRSPNFGSCGSERCSSSVMACTRSSIGSPSTAGSGTRSLAAIFSSVATAIVFRHLLGKPDGVSWLAAAFMFVGYITHLTLDEIYSVDVMDTRIKSSFGTALKFFDRRHVAASVAMLAATAAAIVISPQTGTFVEGLSSRSLWTGLQQRLLPTDKWFGIVETPHFASRKQDSGITTGSIAGHAGAAKAPGLPRYNKPAPATEAAPAPAVVSRPVPPATTTDAPSGSANP